jgi:3,4-dihydroxy 2-butanone 4-phosphate synthase
MSVMSSSAIIPELVAVPFQERFNQALADMRRGYPVILMDDFDRENEADLIVAAEMISSQTMALMIRECSGIVCLCLNDDVLGRLDLKPMVPNNQSRFQTAFTVSIDARDRVTTGVSAQDRVTTIQTAIADNAQPRDLVRPGHVFPLRAVSGGVLSRQGHTEGSVDLALLSGLKPAAVLSEITNPDGTMTKGEEIQHFAELHGMTVLTIEELVQYRQNIAVTR